MPMEVLTAKINQSERAAPHESFSAEGGKAKKGIVRPSRWFGWPMPRAYSHFERMQRGAFQVMNFLEFLHCTNLKADAVSTTIFTMKLTSLEI